MHSHTVLVFAVALLLGACQKSPAEEANPVELRAYDVPKGTGRPLITTFKDVFWVNDKTAPVGHATLSPDGRLMVVAPHNVQTGVQDFVDEITKHPPTYDAMIELRYWVIVGRPAPAPGPISPALKEVQPALDEITRTQGPQTFELEQRVRLSALHDEWGKTEAAPGDTALSKITISQRAVQSNDGVFASIEIHYAKNDKIETRVRLNPDQTVILGATGQRVDGPDAGDGGTLYYLVRVAPRADGQHP